MRNENPVRLTSAQMGTLNHLNQLGPSGAKQIASALGVTTVAVRNHLSTLETGGHLG